LKKKERTGTLDLEALCIALAAAFPITFPVSLIAFPICTTFTFAITVREPVAVALAEAVRGMDTGTGRVDTGARELA
jgi:hypothetical protein